MVLTDKVFRVSYFRTVALTEDDIVLYLENYMRDVKKKFCVRCKLLYTTLFLPIPAS